MCVEGAPRQHRLISPDRLRQHLPRHHLPLPELTDREREVLALIARGASTAEIAESLVPSPTTVGNHITNIFGKLQITDPAQAIIRAREAGLRGDSG